MSRFKAIGSSIYEKGDRIGCTPDEAAVELARKLNAYQMRVERFKAEVDQLMIFCNCTLIPNKELQAENARLKAEVERLTNQNALATPRHLIASQDIKTLREQIEELKLENSQYEEHHKYGQNVITSLREEVERLTKAGDAMAGSHITLIQVYLKDSSDEWHQELHNRWLAAKEGKPSA